MGCLTLAYQLLFLQLFLLYSQTSATLCSYDQRIALLQFKQHFSYKNFLSDYYCDFLREESFRFSEILPYCDGRCPSYQKTMSWKEDTDCCSWDGVTCDNLTGHVIALDLSCGWLHGDIPSNSSLFLFRHLQRLNLAFNDFNLSQVSSDFSQLPSLTHLNLSNSNFSGKIPTEISHLSNLVSLDLSISNYIFEVYYWEVKTLMRLETAVFQELVQNLTKLTELRLDYVDMSTIVPSFLTNLSYSLTSLSLNYCGLQGNILDHIFRSPNLQFLSLRGNLNLTGVFPKVNWSSPLKFMDVSDMSLSGELPNSIGDLMSLYHLRLYDCNIVGSIPMSLGNLTQLTYLSLSSNNFNGHIPSFLSNLVQLRRFDLSMNNFVGEFPDIFVNFSQLSHLDLARNQLSGQIPSHAGGLRNLVVISLSSNSLNGTIPSWLFNHPFLKEMDLRDNQLIGHIDQFQSNSLKMINIDDNRLQGSIPSSIFELDLFYLSLSSNNLSGIVELHMFSKLKNLTWLDLSHNSLSVRTKFIANSSFPQLDLLRLSSCNISEFPGILRSLNLLDTLDLSENKIHGKIPNWMWNISQDRLRWLNLSHNYLTSVEQLPWKNLEYLDLHSNLLQGQIPIPPPHLILFSLSNNELTGEIPHLTCNMSMVEILDLSYNRLSGIIPECMGNFSSLQVLDLRKNRFYGSIPGTFAKGNVYRTLNLNDNGLEGSVPRSLLNCSKLEVLDLGNNKINDTFPYWLGNLQLHVLDLRKNRFYGSIPGTFAKGNVYRTLNLNDNGLEGPVPRSLLNCSKLEVLDLGNNKINDTFPYWLGNLPELRVLVLNSNKFYGSIRDCSKTNKCFPKLRIFDLSNNSFSNFLPTMFFKNLEAMMDVGEDERELKYMGEDYYQDSVILAWKGHEIQLERIITTCTTIDFSNNYFHGEIPGVIGNLHALHLLNLSHNNLSGCIPSSFGNLTALESLDLSSNKLTGKIPWQLANLNFLGWLNLSQNRLSGPVPRANHFDTFSNNSYDGNLALCGFPLSQKCGTDDAKPQPPSTLEDDAESSCGFGWKVVLMGYGCGMILGMTMGYLVFSTGKPQWVIRIVEGGHPRKGRRLKKKRGGR